MKNLNQNWPKGVNFAEQNWNQRFKRKASHMDTYHSLDDGITLAECVGVALALTVIFGFVPFLGWLMGAV